jgi:hypothetical protein
MNRFLSTRQALPDATQPFYNELATSIMRQMDKRNLKPC